MQAPLGTSRSASSPTPAVTHCSTGTSVCNSPSPSARSTSASHGVGVPPGTRSGERSHGSVRRRSTTWGSLDVKEPRAPAGGNVPRIWSGGRVKRGATTSMVAGIVSTGPGRPVTSPVSV
jgi:hypothetical protein